MSIRIVPTTMKLRKDWRYLLNRAWSIRLMILSVVLVAVEISLPLFNEIAPRNAFAVLSMLVAVSAAVVRVMNQPSMDRRRSDEPVETERRKE